MGIKIKNSQLNNETLGVLNQLIELDINASAAFKLARIIKHISSIVEDKLKYERKIYEKWISRDEKGEPLASRDEKGNPIEGTITVTDIESFTKEMTDLLEVENEIPFDKLDFEDLNLKSSKIKDLIRIEFLFN